MSHKHPVPTKDDLEKYYKSVKSISKTAKHFGTSNPTVRKWLQSYDIKSYSHSEAMIHDVAIKTKELPSKEELLFLYNNISISDIRKMYNIGQETFYEWLEHYSIKKVDHGYKVSKSKENIFSKRFDLSKGQIEEDYVRLGCMGSLANYYNCSMTTIKKLFTIYNIEAKFAKSSVGQNEVNDFIQSLGFSTDTNTRKIISPMELDIFIPEKNVAIEYCGEYYHSETWGNKDKNYHYNKYMKCKEQGIKLITIFENEWKNKKEIVKSIISTKLGKTQRKIHARNTKFVSLPYSIIKTFEEENHIQGSRPASMYFGLMYNDELVMTISIGKSRYNKKYKYETIRMTGKRNTIVVGGVSKLYKNINITDCITYTDNRYGEGKSYLSSGFTLSHVSMPNYFYHHKSSIGELYSRNKFQKHKIENVDVSKTEYENMLDRGYDRIWDCGNTVYVKHK